MSKMIMAKIEIKHIAEKVSELFLFSKKKDNSITSKKNFWKEILRVHKSWGFIVVVLINVECEMSLKQLLGVL